MNTSVRPTRQNFTRNHERGENIKKRLQKLEAVTNCPVIHINGQRVCGPPRKWNKPVPVDGSEIFVGNIPRWILEDELMEIFSLVGNIYVIRLMIDFNGFNRGFAFITYEDSEQAEMAVKYLNNFRIRPKHCIGVYKSVDNRRLFIGGIPEEKTREEVKVALERYVEDLTDVIMYSSHSHNITQICNRGYVFAEFKTHRSAAIARRLLNFDVKLWEDASSPVSVDWADPIPEVDPHIIATVRFL
ncbi:hypothetical protein ILUMI_27115 [Ignelater luminosus]|uniref:RRM domain-containing protein n=1 Tax=Ignelater luminosus TaxID=2038154 RepID=A0A8K0C5F9_IGNLU|nr:hypothetical protein ILUMI_27115 [Ignelater luminosus]